MTGGRIAALGISLLLTALLIAWALHAGRRFDQPTPTPVRLVEQPMIRPVVPLGWVWLDQAEGFSVYGPPGTTHHRDDGIDWAGGRFEAADFTWGYYIGFVPQGLHSDGDPVFTEEPVTIDGRSGIIQRYTYPAGEANDGRRYYSRLLLAHAFARYDYGSTDHALDLFGRTATPQGQADMERMWRTIRFDLREVRELVPVHGRP